MTLISYLTILLFLFPPVYSLIRYQKKPPEQRPRGSEVAGILFSAAVTAATLVYMMSQRIFF